MEHRTDAGAKVALGSVLFVQVIPVIVAASSHSAKAVWAASVATMAVSACAALVRCPGNGGGT